MKANELMIGDWVYDTLSQTNVKVNRGCFEINPLNGICYAENLIPIPLTPKILEKNGFVNDDNIYDLKYYQSCGDVIGVDIRGDIGYLEDADLKYVHRLQHALRLCGIEKEIEL